MKVLLLILFIPSCIGYRSLRHEPRVGPFPQCCLCTHPIGHIGDTLKEGGPYAVSLVNKTLCDRDSLEDRSVFTATKEDSKFCYHVMDSALSDSELIAKIRDASALPREHDSLTIYLQICVDKFGVCAKDLKEHIEEDMEGSMEENMERSIEDDMEGSIEDDMEGSIEDGMEGSMEDDMEGGIEDYMEGSIEDNIEAGIEDFNKWNAKDVQRKSFWNRCDICMYAIDGIGKFRNAEPEITDNKLAETVCEHLKDDSSSIPNEEDKRFCYHVMGYALSDRRLQARILDFYTPHVHRSRVSRDYPDTYKWLCANFGYRHYC